MYVSSPIENSSSTFPGPVILMGPSTSEPLPIRMPPRRRSAVRIRLKRRCGKNHETAPVNTLRPSTLVSSRPARQTREPRCAKSFICLRGIESTITAGGSSARRSPNDPPRRMARTSTPAITCDAISLGIARPPAQRDRGAPCPDSKRATRARSNSCRACLMHFPCASRANGGPTRESTFATAWRGERSRRGTLPETKRHGRRGEEGAPSRPRHAGAERITRSPSRHIVARRSSR